MGEIARQVADGVPVGTALLKAGEQLGGVVAGTSSRPASSDNGRVVGGEVTSVRSTSLRERGQELLEKSRDVWATDDRHPAFDRILDDLAPDEARILVMLLKNGPQASVDIRTGGPVGMLSSQLIAPGLNMVGPRAGLRYLDQVPSYLNNLYRLGLVWFSREALRDHLEYQVLEAQPDVLAAMHSVKFAKVVRRSIHLTPFGEEFVKQALVDEVDRDQPRAARSTTPRRRSTPTEAAVLVAAVGAQRVVDRGAGRVSASERGELRKQAPMATPASAAVGASLPPLTGVQAWPPVPCAGGPSSRGLARMAVPRQPCGEPPRRAAAGAVAADTASLRLVR